MNSTDRDGKNVQDWVDDLIKENPIIVFSKSFCPFCVRARKAFEDANIENYSVVELAGREDCDIIQDYLEKLTGARTVPRVFIHGNFIGGGTEVQQLQKEGKLAEIVNIS